MKLKDILKEKKTDNKKVNDILKSISYLMKYSYNDLENVNDVHLDIILKHLQQGVYTINKVIKK